MKKHGDRQYGTGLKVTTHDLSAEKKEIIMKRYESYKHVPREVCFDVRVYSSRGRYCELRFRTSEEVDSFIEDVSNNGFICEEFDDDYTTLGSLYFLPGTITGFHVKAIKK